MVIIIIDYDYDNALQCVRMQNLDKKQNIGHNFSGCSKIPISLVRTVPKIGLPNQHHHHHHCHHDPHPDHHHHHHQH